MKLSIVLIIIAVVTVLVGGYFFMTGQKSPVVAASDTAGSIVQNAWIEVTSDPVYLDVAGEKTPLKSGDSLGVGATIETGSTGVAIIHFPDASLARIDVDTTLTLSALSFNTDDNSLVVSIGLSIGRVWSKVMGLATPESSWEVTTSNTVATVRGTAFGVGYKKDGTSWVLGSQHTVAVAPLDPKTKQKIANAEILLQEDRLIQLTNRDAAIASTAISSSTIAAKVTPLTGDFRTDTWIHAERAADKKIDEKIDTLRREGANDASVRDEIHKEEVKLKETLIQTPKDRPAVTPEETKKDTVVPPLPKVEPKPAERPPVVAPIETPKKIAPPSAPAVTPSTAPSRTTAPAETVTTTITAVSANRTVNDLTEGDTVQFTAVAGTGSAARDITNDVSWQVVGSIGAVTSGGLFTARLGSDVSESGEGVGGVIMTLPNGKVITSAPIHVQAKIPTDLGTEG